jgi:hypothetical protein
VGGRKSRVVIGKLLSEIGPDAETVATTHESSHMKAGDAKIQALGLVLAVFVPWNPAIWWQFARLRDAVEGDCDLRVVDAGIDVKTYASLLLEIASNRVSSPFPAVAFLSSRTQLGRRVVTMAEYNRPPRYIKTALVAAFGVALTATACETPQPLGVEPDSEIELAAERAILESSLSELHLGVPALASDQAELEGALFKLRETGTAEYEGSVFELAPEARGALHEVELREMVEGSTVRLSGEAPGGVFEFREQPVSAENLSPDATARFETLRGIEEGQAGVIRLRPVTPNP